MMTDKEIRQWIDRECDPEELPLSVSFCEEMEGLLRELLQYRAIHAEAKFRVWQPDDSPQGWRCVALFPEQYRAVYYRDLVCPEGSLVLPINEVPALTAR